MAYRLKQGETVPENIRRIVHEEVDSALKELNHSNGKKRDEGIHEARKSIKKIRGAMRLVAPELGRAYKAENTRLQSVGQKLSEIRDATAIIEVFDGLVEKHKDGLQKSVAGAIRRGLEASKQETIQRAGITRGVKSAVTVLRSIGKRVDKWPLEQDGFPAIASGLEDRYRRGKRAMAAVRKDGAPEKYHEWRKRVKDHWYHVRLMESLWTQVMQAHEGSLHDLETWLGDDHNLVVLCGKLAEAPEQFGGEENSKLFLAVAQQEQKELREKALSIGERVYERKSKRFVRDMEKLWDAWQQQPDTMKDEQKEQRQAPKKGPGRAGTPARKTAVA